MSYLHASNLGASSTIGITARVVHTFMFISATFGSMARYIDGENQNRRHRRKHLAALCLKDEHDDIFN
jgi:hypothetical protein